MALSVAVLALGAFNLTFRLGRESLTEWDESLYATSSLEVVTSGDWIVTASNGVPDYSNSKPPLNVWLLALALKTLGPNLISLRLPSVVSAWLTILVLLLWAQRRFSSGAGLFAALVLATSFGFLHVHSGRTANPDALLTLLLLLVVITLDAARDQPWWRVWLGPLLAGVFMLKGMAVAMPLLLIVMMEARRRLDHRSRWLPLAAALGLGATPVAAWAIARWNADGWIFFDRLFFQDFVDLSATSMDGHSGSPAFYLNILSKHHYDWMVAALTAIILSPPTSWASVRQSLAFWRGANSVGALLGFWAGTALLVPTLMQTKLPWYLNSFYPVFALGIGWVLNNAFSRMASFPRHHRGLLIAMIVVASTVAEAKLIWYSYAYRALEHSVQGLLLMNGNLVRGHRVFKASWDGAERFALRGLVMAEAFEAATIDDFLRDGMPGDYLVMPVATNHPALVRVNMAGDYALYRFRD